MTPICPHCGTGEETAERSLLLCPKWAAERQWYFGDSTEIIDVLLTIWCNSSSLRGICPHPI